MERLLDLIKSGTKEEIFWLISNIQVTDLNKITDKQDRSLLHLACLYNTEHEDVAVELLDRGLSSSEPDFSTERGTAFLYACRNGMYKVVEKIIHKEKGKVPYDTDPEYQNALHYVVNSKINSDKDLRKICEILIEGCQSRHHLIHAINSNGFTPLALALNLKKYEAVELFIHSGMEFKCVPLDTESRPELNYISFSIRNLNENPDNLIKLKSLSEGEVSEALLTAVDLTVPNSKYEYDGDDFSDKGFYNQGRCAYRKQWVESLISFIKEKGLKKDVYQRDLLKISYEKGTEEITKLLIREGAMVKLLKNVMGSKNETCEGNILHGAIDSYLYGQYALAEVSSIIDKYGAELLQQQSSCGLAALSYAVQCNHSRAGSQASRLIKLSHASSHCHTSFDEKQCQLVKLLISKGCDVNEQDNNGYTVIMRAVQKENTDLMGLLLHHEADPRIRNKINQNAYDLKQRCLSQIVVKSILSRGTRTHILADESVKKVVATKAYLDISDADINVLKHTQLTLAKIRRPGTEQSRKAAQKDACLVPDVKQKIAKDENTDVLKSMLHEKGLLGECSLEGKTQEEVVDILLQVLYKTEPGQFDDMLSELHTSTNDVWEDIFWRCAEILYSDTWTDEI